MTKRRISHSRKTRSATAGLIVFAGMDRVKLLMIGFGAMSLLIITRLFVVQVMEHGFYEQWANDQHTLAKQLLPERGEIYAQDQFSDSGLAVIATNQTVYHVFANPKQIPIVDKQKTADAVADVLGLDSAMVLERLSKENDVYEPLKHGVSEQELNALEKIIHEQQLPGIDWTPEDARLYPEGKATSAITGFVGMADDHRKGQYGLEGYFDTQMAGTPGSIRKELDAFGRFIAIGDNSIVEAQDGDSLILTIDKNIQYTACWMLSDTVESLKAEQGSVIVMNPKTGAILAMCNAPEYDPNHYSDVDDIQLYMNDAVSDQYEPGSVLKPIAVAAAINEGKITPYTTYEDTGEVKIEGYSINNSDFKAHGVVDMTTVLELSLNTGAVYAVQQIGNERWNNYIQQFGFGKKTGITLNGENAGNISSVAKLQDIYSATSSYGQGMTITPLQLVQAYSAFANDGVMMKPYIVDRVVKSNGYQEVTQPEPAGQPISPETARTVGAMLVRVVDGPHAKPARLDGYFVAGKTGTAQVPKENGVGYDEHLHKDTFIGFVSVSDPQAVILVKIDKPQSPWAETSAAPLFGKLSQYLVNYLKIQPDRSE
ncbi:MAG: penicillin-binding protein 2 [Candidatus Kerfeldbacteria bacterium]|nr:penicillin-binding protein 2 [Candidatus Kerfeldbacteria bacterium]